MYMTIARNIASFTLICAVISSCSEQTNEPSYTATRGYSGCATGTEVPTNKNVTFEEAILTLVNEERAKRNINPLQRKETLSRAAQYHSYDMAMDNYFSHQTHDRNAQGGLVASCETFERIRTFDSQGNGENIAAGSPTPTQTMAQWMQSTGHRDNILNPRYRYLGVGYHNNTNAEYNHYWTQVFGE